MPDDNLSSFVEFINRQLDLSGLDAPSPFTDTRYAPREQPDLPLNPLDAPTFTPEEFSRLLSEDVYAETLRLVRAEMRDPDGLPLKFGLLHREVLYHLSNIISTILRAKYPEQLNADQWRDAAALAIALAWLVRSHLDTDDPHM